MKLPEHERAAHREAFRAMNLFQKADYIFAYYKLPLVLIFIAVVAIGSVVHYQLTHKEPVLYVGYANVVLDEPIELDEHLTSGFLAELGDNPRTQEVSAYRDLYISDAEESVDHQYSYASRLKLLASIDAEQLDVVFMNKNAYDLLSHSGFLLDLSALLAEQDAEVAAKLAPLVTSNDVIIEDNELEVQLNEADVYEAVTEVAQNALDVSGLPLFQNLSGDIYLGVIGNTPRTETALRYILYLYAWTQD